ncbi:hypothetical protein PGUG_02165 [Meyerozyma guilliermondii ATCC 6260]|uniref:GPI transamidase component GAA1 n=2 Tax=Dikarya TaxID=451864 RepID=A5DFW4_PICGU|nr:uncharacterized protein PGUG_02165 [Meyerozyma guilliermondii ATCC 6260]EDK38067.1 hypothetical protein PGUG_02165 [Meyerozyma guilliermondii ATCC 6260]
MALAEALLRKVHKYGLFPKIVRLLPVISLGLAIASAAWLASLPMDGNYRNTYISENALMPAQVTSYFRESEWNIVRGYRGEILGMELMSVSERNAIVETWLADIGLKSAYHVNQDGDDTLYAIMHAPRGDDTEAMVLSIPWQTSDGKYNVGGAALGMALSRYFSRMSIWSKNIIVVFSPDGHESLRSWVEAYHTSLDNTAGSIDAAIVMEFASSSDHFDYYEIHYEGLNGQLPNLDLINTIVTVASGEAIGCSLQEASLSQLGTNNYSSRLRTMLKSIVSMTLAGITPNSPGCEAFSGWQIQAVTLKAKGESGRHDVTQFGRIVDSTFRSVNNLLEKFHQSFFFYLLLSPTNFVSIGTYLPSAIMFAVAYALSSLGCLLSSGITATKYLHNIGYTLSLFTSLQVVCYSLCEGLPFLLRQASDKEEAAGVILQVLSFLSAVIALGPILTRSRNIKLLDRTTSSAMIALCLFFIAMLVTALLIVHFALALALGVLCLPLTFIYPIISTKVNAREKSIKSELKICLCSILSNPFFLIYVAGEILGLGVSPVDIMTGLLTSWHTLQCWTWYVFILGWFCVWLGISLTATFGRFEPEVTRTKKEE